MITVILDNDICTVIKGMDKIKPFLTVPIENEYSTLDSYKLYHHNTFKAGLLPIICSQFKTTVIDRSTQYNFTYTPIDGVDFMPHQQEGLKALENSYLETVNGPVPFRRGIYDEATNTGKTYIMAGIIQGFNKDTLILVHDELLLNQLVTDLSSILKTEVGYITSSKTVINKITIAMYKTLFNRVKKSVNMKLYIQSIPILLVDESHNVSKTYAKLVDSVKTFHKLFFSGTSLMRVSDIDNLKNIARCGDIIHSTSSKYLREAGVSMEAVVTMYELKAYAAPTGWVDYEKLMYSRERLEIIKDNALTSDHCLIAISRLEHGKFLVDNIPGSALYTGHNKKADLALFEDFKSGKIRILVTTILREGLNIKTLDTLIIAMGGADAIAIVQLIGRLIRNDGSGKVLRIVDFIDGGKVSSINSQKRLKIYKDQDYQIIVK